MPYSKPIKSDESWKCFCGAKGIGQKAKSQHLQGEPHNLTRGYANTGNPGYRSGWKKQSEATYKSRFGREKGGPHDGSTAN
jgi:hypothetical protein